MPVGSVVTFFFFLIIGLRIKFQYLYKDKCLLYYNKQISSSLLAYYQMGVHGAQSPGQLDGRRRRALQLVNNIIAILIMPLKAKYQFNYNGYSKPPLDKNRNQDSLSLTLLACPRIQQKQINQIRNRTLCVCNLPSTCMIIFCNIYTCIYMQNSICPGISIVDSFKSSGTCWLAGLRSGKYEYHPPRSNRISVASFGAN